MNVKGLSKECEQWWKATALHYGYRYRGRASLKNLLTAIYSGEIKLEKVVDKGNQ